MDYVVPIDFLSTIFFGIALFLSLKIRVPIFDKTSRTFLYLSLGIYFLVGMFNILEHTGVTGYLDRYEDYMEIVFITFFLVFLYSVHVNIDLRQREEVEISLRDSEEQYRTLVETIPHGIHEINREGITTFVNSSQARALGYSVESMIGESMLNLLPSDEDRKRFRNFFNYLIEVQPKPTPWFGKDVTKDGRIRDLRVDWNYKRDRNGNITGFVTLISDITESKKAEEKLKLFHNLIDRSNDAIYIIDPPSGTILDANEKALKDLNYEREELIGMSILDIDVERTDKSKWTEYVDNLRERGSMIFSGKLKRKDESILPVEVNVTYIDMGDKGYMLAIVRDITERIKMEEEMLKTQKLESLGVLAGGLAHDFNNLLTAILGYVSIAKIHTKKDKKVWGQLTEAEKACMRAKDLTRQLITFSKGGEPIKQIISINRIINETVKFSLSGSNVVCNCNVTNEIWPVEADEGQISQVLNNLLINAVQAMPQGGAIHIECHNVHSSKDPALSSRDGDFIKLIVQDEGIGIPKKYLPNIFDPYYTTKQKGSGLGLATVYSIVKKHDGEIFVRSELGKGTRFTIYLPAATHEHSLVDYSEAQPERGEGKILIMDDEVQIRTALQEILSNLGYTAETAAEGNEAINMFELAYDSGTPFNAVILDLTVPGGLGGEETLRKLIEIDPDVKAIVSSGYSDDKIMSDHRKYGFKGVITKPYTPQQLSTILKEILS
jgi:two-component system cell cycle sensor histidine kinase/response regulator CckA